MGCPDVDTMAQMVCGALPPPAVATLEVHLADCGSCREVLAVLAGSVLSQVGADSRAATEAAGVRAAAPPRFLRRDDRLDRYAIRECLGAGGMGIVYAAHDPELDREVALKVLRPELAGERALLVAEARAAARLHHPNVITVHEVGMAGDEVFIAMALCRGGTLRRWLREPRSVEEILALAADIGRGLAAAHHAGLVHCDFKPDNVLLDERGRPCVSDFGLARPADGSGGNPGGTPAYMAPEQRAGAAPDARADQYAFCLVVREALGQQAQPRWLTRALDRGLAPDPEARFVSLDALVAVFTRDRGRRRRWIAGGAALLVAAGAAVAVAATRPAATATCSVGDGAARAWSAADRVTLAKTFGATGAPFATEAAATVTAALDRWRTGWEALDVAACRGAAGAVSGALRERQATCLARGARDVAALVDVLSTADAAVVERAIAMVESATALEPCADPLALASEVAPPPAPQRAAIEALRERLAHARAMRLAGHDREALPGAERIATDAAATGYQVVLGEALTLVGELRFTLDDSPGAERALRDAATAADAAHDDRTRAEAWISLGYVLQRAERDTELNPLLGSIDGLVRRLDGDRAIAADLARLTSDAYRGRGEYDAALVAARAALEGRRAAAAGTDRISVASAQLTVGATLDRMGKSDEALVELNQALAMTQRVLGDHHPDVAHALQLVAQSQTNLGRLPEARAALERALEIRLTYLGPEHRSVATLRSDLALVLTDLGKRDEALAQIELSLATLERVLGPTHTDVATALAYRGDIYTLTGDDARGLLDYQRAIDINEAHDREHPRLADLYGRKADALRWADRLDDALVASQRAHQIRVATSPPGDPVLAYDLHGMGTIQLLRGDARAALPLLEEALALRAGADRDPLEHATTGFAIARTLRALQRDPARVRKLAEDARVVFAAAGPAAAERLAESDAFLRQ